MKESVLLNTLKKFNKFTKYVEMVFVSGAVMLMVFDLAGSFISRNLFNKSWTFAEEVGSFSLIVLTFMGIGYCSRLGRHIRMSAVFDILPFKAKKIFNYIICAVTAAALFYFAYLGFLWVFKTYHNAKVSSVMRFPMYIIYSSVPFGCFMGAIQYVFTFIQNIIEPDDVYIGSEAKDYEVKG